MPKGPQGQRRPADSNARAVMVARIATGEIKETPEPIKSAAAELGSRGGKARAAKLSDKKRKEIAQKAAAKRWKSD
jgi:hypothetical protein